MVRVVAFEVIQMERQHTVVDEPLKKFPQQIDIKITDPPTRIVDAIEQPWAARSIHYNPGQRFV